MLVCAAKEKKEISIGYSLVDMVKQNCNCSSLDIEVFTAKFQLRTIKLPQLIPTVTNNS